MIELTITEFLEQVEIDNLDYLRGCTVDGIPALGLFNFIFVGIEDTGEGEFSESHTTECIEMMHGMS